MPEKFHEKPYDDGTLAKLRIFELYTQEWIPVFLSPEKPKFSGGVHIFDFFCGPGRDAVGVPGSPLRILTQLRNYQKMRLAGWGKVPIVAHFHDSDDEKIAKLKALTSSGEWSIPGVTLDVRCLTFEEALEHHNSILTNSSTAKLLIIDQFGVDAVTDQVFKRLASFLTTDFIFFLTSSTLHRFRDHHAIKQKIETVADSYDVHRSALKYYRNLLRTNNDLYLGPFSIKKRSNIYGLIFGSRHPLGIHKFLQVAWKTDEIAGEANFDIERENIRPGEGLLPLEEFRPTKIREFEQNLELHIRKGEMKSEGDVIRYCIECGMTSHHAVPILKKLQTQRLIEIAFRVPDIGRIKNPRPIRLVK